MTDTPSNLGETFSEAGTPEEREAMIDAAIQKNWGEMLALAYAEPLTENGSCHPVVSESSQDDESGQVLEMLPQPGPWMR